MNDSHESEALRAARAMRRAMLGDAYVDSVTADADPVAAEFQDYATTDKFPQHVLTERYASGFANSLMAKDLRHYLAPRPSSRTTRPRTSSRSTS